jgi:hypothetical protein
MCTLYQQSTAAAGGGSSADWLVGGGVPLRPNEDPRYFNPDVGGAGVPQGVGVDELRLRMQQQQAAQQRGMYYDSTLWEYVHESSAARCVREL